MEQNQKAIAGCLLGLAVGDALGLPREGLSRKRVRALFGVPPLQHCLITGHGMVSDDTEHACMVAQALLDAAGDPVRFANSLAWRLRGWFLTLPPGVGLATLRACIKLCLGFSPERSGVWSAGNGPAMRAPLLGVCIGDNPRLIEFVRVSTRITHTDPKAERGAYLVALAAAWSVRASAIPTQEFLSRARVAFPASDEELDQKLQLLEKSLINNRSVMEFADALGLQRGCPGYIYHTVPVVLYAWLRHQGDFRSTVEQVIQLGGDTDTTGAIAGAIAGASAGPQGIPQEWFKLWEWPRTVRWLRHLADQLAQSIGSNPTSVRTPSLFWPALPLRNAFLLTIVLAHGFRRILPPYG